MTVYSVWDGWNLYAEFSPGNPNSPTERLVYGSGGDLLLSPLNHQYYHPNAFGSTAYLCDGQGNLLERYKYDMNGVVTVYGPNNNVLPGASVSHLYNEQQWYPELQLYDLRNRYYKPDIGRFLQPDPTGFAGDSANLYRYCGNNPASLSDNSGDGPATVTRQGTNVNINIPINFIAPPGQSLPPDAVGAFKNGIEQLLTGSGPGFGGYNVTTTVELGDFSGYRIEVYAGTTISETVKGGDFWGTSGRWYYDPATAAFVAAHEVLHLLGLPAGDLVDGYSRSNGIMGPPLPGFENSILGGVQGGVAFRPGDIEKIIELNQSVADKIKKFFQKIADQDLTFSWETLQPGSSQTGTTPADGLLSYLQGTYNGYGGGSPLQKEAAERAFSKN